MSLRQQLSSFATYYCRVVAQIFADVWRLAKQQVIIGAVATILILVLQIHYGIIPKQFTLSSILAVVYPYLLIVACALIFHAVRAPWILDNKRQEEIETLLARATEHQRGEDKGVRRKFLRERLAEFMREGEKIKWGILAGTLDAHKEHQPWL